MAKIEFLGPISRQDTEIDVANLKELKDMLSKDEKLKPWLEISSVALNGNIVSSLDVALNKNDVVSLLPPVCGG